tara:strand:- start:6534 stop:7193 length:660 start_codon:yes stop_codon:yes gene_type:complete
MYFSAIALILLFIYYIENVVLFSLQAYSYCEIKINNLNNNVVYYINYYIKKNNKIINDYCYIIVKNGDEVNRLTYNEIINTKFEYDMILLEYKKYDDEFLNETYLIRYNNYYEIINDKNESANNNEEHVKSNINILNPVIKLNKKTYPLKITDYNYIIIGNIIFDKIFIEWWFNKYHNYKLKSYDDYEIYFFDCIKDINLIKLTNINSVYVDNDNYILK